VPSGRNRAFPLVRIPSYIMIGESWLRLVAHSRDLKLDWFPLKPTDTTGRIGSMRGAGGFRFRVGVRKEARNVA
jgi:hypothetical protein